MYIGKISHSIGILCFFLGSALAERMFLQASRSSLEHVHSVLPRAVLGSCLEDFSLVLLLLLIHLVPWSSNEVSIFFYITYKYTIGISRATVQI